MEWLFVNKRKTHNHFIYSETSLEASINLQSRNDHHIFFCSFSLLRGFCISIGAKERLDSLISVSRILVQHSGNYTMLAQLEALSIIWYFISA